MRRFLAMLMFGFIFVISVKLHIHLSTYASWWIKQSVSRAVAEKSRIIRLPVHVHDMMVSLTHAMQFPSLIPYYIFLASLQSSVLTLTLYKGECFKD